MAMFISKTLTTAIIRYNTGPTIQKPPLQALGIGGIPSTNVGVVKPMNMGSFGVPPPPSNSVTLNSNLPVF